MAKINFANTAKLGFWDFVIDFTTREPKLISGDYKDLRAKIESGELIDGVVVLPSSHNTNAFGYERLANWMVVQKLDNSVEISLEFEKSSFTIEEDNTVRIKGTSHDPGTTL